MSDTQITHVLGTSDYDVDSMDSVRDLELVRLRPMLYLRDVELPGQIHIGFEIIDNTIDEAGSVGDITNVPVEIVICRDLERKTYQLVVRDGGRGIPIGTSAKGINVFLNSTTVLNTSAKFGKNSAYAASGGLNGVGMKLAAGLSTKFKAITHRPDQSAVIRVDHGKHKGSDDRYPGPYRGGKTGVTVAYELDPEYIHEIEAFADTGYLMMIDRLKRYVFFRRYNIKLYVSDTPLPNKFWSADASESEDILDATIQSSTLVWDAAQSYDPTGWVRQFWEIQRPFAWTWEFSQKGNPGERLQEIIVRLYAVKFERVGGRMSLINNIPVDDPNSYQFTVLQDVFAKAIAPFIGDRKVREFFLKSYKLPLYIAVDVKFTHAKFIGNTKESFKDPDFRSPYRSILDEYVKSDVGRDMIIQIYDQLAEDIQTRYNESLGPKTSTKPIGRLFELLKRPLKFHNCSGSTDTELFLVEGDSASGCEHYDKSFQAMYLLSGKPLNVLKKFPIGTPRSVLLAELLKHPVFQDIFTIINYNPMKPNLDELTFKRVLLLTDADAHGGHIASIVLGDIAAVAPELVEAGIFQIVVAPYYRITVGKKDYYTRGQEDFIPWCCEFFYAPALKIEIVHASRTKGKPIELTGNVFTDFIQTIDHLGTMIGNIASELSIEPEIIEALIDVTYYLTPQTMNTDVIKDALGASAVTYDAVSDSIIVNIGRDDIVIPLSRVSQRLYRNLRPAFNRVEKDKWVPLVTTKMSSLYKKEPMSVYQLFRVLRSFDSMMKVEPLKGIGGMESDEIWNVCMNPKHRNVIEVKNVGDVERVHDLLGRDSRYKKALMSAPLESVGRIFG